MNHRNGCNMFVHRDYAQKACPGDYLYNLHPYIAQEVNKMLGVTTEGRFVYKGTDFSDVFDPVFYAAVNPDLKVFNGDPDLLFAHFWQYGMNECRQAKDNFNVIIYRMNYSDLNTAFGDNWFSYYWHYCVCGKNENRIAA